MVSLDDPLLTTEDVGKMFGVDAATVRDWIRDGKLEGKKLHGYWRVLTSEATRLAKEMYDGA
jgi:predicted site-specific integrase-resolvase